MKRLVLKNSSKSAVGLAVMLSLVFIISSVSSVSALSGSSFKKDRIIDDAKFYRTSSMSASSIQSFLNSKLSSCDTNGAKSKSYYYRSSNGRVNDSRDTWVTTSRATYGSRLNKWNGTSSKAPYVCLKNYKVNTPSRPTASGLCSYISAKSNRTAAQIINDVSNACGIDSKVLLVTLQKEQGLLTDDWPWTSQYRIAMGYGCPDDAACNSAYYGFFNQVYNAAKQLKNYRKNPGSFNYAVNRTSFVSYQANNSSCGGTNITMRNAATAALYNYTPYQPNDAALDNLYGTGNSCSAYGNRNFWRFYNDWFGSTLGHGLTVSRSLYESPSSAFAGEEKAASFILKNNTSQAVTIISMTVAVRDSKNHNFNFPHLHDVTIQPGSSYTYYQRRIFNSAGSYRSWITFKTSSGKWYKTWPPSSSSSIIRERSFKIRMPDVRVTRSLYESPSSAGVGDEKATSFKIKNYEDKPITFTSIVVAVRNRLNQNVNFPSVHNITLQPGETYTYYQRRTFNTTGKHSMWIAVKQPNGSWSKTWPTNSSSKIIRQRSFQISN